MESLSTCTLRGRSAYRVYSISTPPPYAPNAECQCAAATIIPIMNRFCACEFPFLIPSQRPYFWNSQSLLSSGHTWRVFNQREMQWKWNAWLQIPHATVHSSLVADAWLAWHSMQRSIIWFLQIAQLSTTMSQAQRATAFHFLTSKRFLPSAPPSAALPALALPSDFLNGAVEPEGASVISTSAMMTVVGELCVWRGWLGGGEGGSGGSSVRQ